MTSSDVNACLDISIKIGRQRLVLGNPYRTLKENMVCADVQIFAGKIQMMYIILGFNSLKVT